MRGGGGGPITSGGVDGTWMTASVQISVWLAGCRKATSEYGPKPADFVAQDSVLLVASPAQLLESLCWQQGWQIHPSGSS